MEKPHINTAAGDRKRRSEQEMTQYWTHRSDSYSDMIRAQFDGERRKSWETAIFEGIGEERPLDILDIGTGPGFFAILCALRGHCVTAVDTNGEMLERARENASALGASVYFQQVGSTPPFERESFDLIICRDVTWTLTEPEEQMRAWGKLLRKNGVLRYFDAEWYHHLNPERNHHGQTLQEHKASGLKTYARAGEMEAIAASLPMTYRKRPEWDEQFWRQEGFSASVRRNMNESVYNAEEREKYRNFPCFCVTVRRDAR